AGSTGPPASPFGRRRRTSAGAPSSGSTTSTVSSRGRSIPAGRQRLRHRPLWIGLEVAPRTVEGELAGLDELHHPAPLGTHRRLVGYPVVVREIASIDAL